METRYRQLSRRAETGLIHKLGPGLYAATAWTPTPSGVTCENANYPALGQCPVTCERHLPEVKYTGLFGALRARATAQHPGCDDALFVGRDGALPTATLALLPSTP